MKIAEALIKRKDLKKNLKELVNRISSCSTVLEGETPKEDPVKLLATLRHNTKSLEDLIKRITLTNATTLIEGVPLIDLINRRGLTKVSIGLLSSCLDDGSYTRRDSQGNKSVALLDLKALRREIDQESKSLRELDVLIQSTNWSTDLVD